MPSPCSGGFGVPRSAETAPDNLRCWESGETAEAPPHHRSPRTGRKRVLSGMRPTGRLHIGHYFGALSNWVRLQNDPQYECFYFVADWHALTTDYADTSFVAQNTIEIATDWLAA